MRMRSAICVTFLLATVSIAIATPESRSFSISPDESLKTSIIRRAGYLPNDDQIAQGCVLKHVGPICSDRQGHIYVADWYYCVIYKFNSSGLLLSSFGKKGQGPDEFGSINDIAAFNEGIAIRDAGNKRCVLIDPVGKVLSSFKMSKQYRGLGVSKDAKRIYMEPDPGDTLVDVLDTKGNLISSFGKKIDLKNRHDALNNVFLCVNQAGEVWAAWKYYPIIRGFSADGRMIAEIRIDDAALDNAIAKNEKAAASTVVSNSVRLMGINNGFYVDEESCYTFLYGENSQPRIVRYDRLGNRTAVYEIADNVDKEIYVNILVAGMGVDTTFSCLQGFPEARVDIFRIDGPGH